MPPQTPHPEFKTEDQTQERRDEGAISMYAHGGCAFSVESQSVYEALVVHNTCPSAPYQLGDHTGAQFTYRPCNLLLFPVLPTSSIRKSYVQT